MNPHWQDFLARHHAFITGGIVQNFGDNPSEWAAISGNTVLCDLHQFGVLRVAGEDAQPFLQNLLSNDIREASLSKAQFSSLNSAKGRMLASFLIWRDNGDYLLQLPHGLIEPVRKKLGMYVLRAKVKISDASDEIISLGIAGSDAGSVLCEKFGGVPSEPFSVLTNPFGGILKIGETRFQVFSTPDQAEFLWATLSPHAKPVGSPLWDWLNIRAGIPVILPQTQEQFIAQMINFDLIGGINFKKGCYPGQEIVARTHYLGKLKRRMYLARIDTDGEPRAGDELFSADMEGQASGMIVNVAPSPDGGHDVLAVVQMSSRETQTVHWKSLGGETLKFLPPPYALPAP